MFSKAFVVLAALALAVNAQNSSTITTAPAPSGSSTVISSCVLGCVIPAAAQNGCSPTDVSCLCTNGQFQADAGACLQTNCPADVAAAIQAQQQNCASASLSPTATESFTPRPVSFTSIPAGPTSSGSAPGASGSSSTSPKPAASGSSGSSPSPSAGTGTSLQAGAGAFFGAILAAVFAL